MKKGIFGFWNPTENTLERFKVFSRFPFFEKKRKPRNDVLATDHARLELGICTLQNEQIQFQYAHDVSSLLSDWQKQHLNLGIAFFRPTPLFSPPDCVMPFFSIGAIAVAYFGIIDNIFEIREKLISDGYQFYSKNVAETLSLLFNHYLEIASLSPIDTMKMMMKQLKGKFVLMVLVEEGKWLMVGCCDYPLIVGKNKSQSTVYFGTDAKTLAQFSSSTRLIFGTPKPEMFCATLLQSEILTPDSF
jgi:glutamine phosphoribosylpyrophosphate amidotransferase